ncbi:MAG TPA: MFS transporter [Stellaceae bacterium]|nr:MFS transporter [Stellaceae bacterium]
MQPPPPTASRGVAPPQSVEDGLPTPQRYWAMLAVGLAITMSVLDSSIANIALPTIAGDMSASPATAIWIVNAYQLAITISLLPLASLGEIYEYRRVYRVGLAVFTAASLACALSHSIVELTAARILQGFGAAGIMGVNTALVRFIYPRAKLGHAIGINAVTVSVGAAVGPTVAAMILSVASWQWLFAINVPIGVFALLLTRALPATPRRRHRFDLIGAALNAGAFGLTITAIDGIGHHQPIGAIAAEAVGAAAIGVALVWRESHQAWPMLPVDLMRIREFSLSVATSVCSFVAQMMAYVALPFYLQTNLGRSAVETGLLMTPWPLMTAVVAPLAGWLADRHPAGILGGIGLAVFGAGVGLLALLPADPAAADIAWRMALCGAGFGLFQSPNNRAIINAAPRERSGGASGMLGTARLFGQTTGAALVALIFGLSAGTTTALAIASGIALVAALVSSLRLFGERKPAVAVETPRRAERLPEDTSGPALAERTMPELRISALKVCDFIEVAREVAGQVPPTTGDRTTSGDDSPLMTIEDNPGTDSRREQMQEFIAGLNIAEQVDLLALIFIGRGDFDITEWNDAVREAGDRIADRDPDYMIGDAALPAYLGDGLNAFDITCD